MKSLILDKPFNSIRRVKPVDAAVAYLGDGWYELLGKQLPERLIVSPSEGTNPGAVLAFINAHISAGKSKAAAWKRLNFLDDLHAKVYIGAKSAVVTSANLSNNASNRLHEAGCVIADPDQIAELRAWFNQQLERSKKQYPDKAAKETKLKKMHQAWMMRESRAAATPRQFSEQSFLDYYESEHKSDFQGVYTMWWAGGGGDYTQELKDTKLNGVSVPDLIDEEYDISVRDVKGIREGDWLLGWKPSAKKTYLKKSIRWMRVDYLHPNASEGERDYPGMAASLKGTPDTPSPFRIDETFKKAFSEVLNSNRELRNELSGEKSKEAWSAVEHRTQMRTLFSEIANRLRKNAP